MTAGRIIGAMRTLLLVDAHAGFRRQARALLERSGFAVVGEAIDGPTAIARVAELRPDVVLLDIGLPGDDGFEVVRALRARGDAPVVVLTSSRSASSYGDRIAASRAAGFLRKDELTAAALADLVGSGR
jgi:DNA-binding NarL/FixJ family response regulator